MTEECRRVTAHFIVFYLGWIGAQPVPSVNLVRQWVHRKKIRRVGTDQWGFALYDLGQAVEYARALGYLDNVERATRHGEDVLADE